MKQIITTVIMFLLCVGLSHAQQEASLEAQNVIRAFFEAFHLGDTTSIKNTICKEFRLETVLTQDSDTKIRQSKGKDFLTIIANRPSNQKWEERLLSFEVNIDGRLAHVWTPYEFYLNGTFSHCGINSFYLLNTASGWRIYSILDTRRNDCP